MKSIASVWGLSFIFRRKEIYKFCKGFVMRPVLYKVLFITTVFLCGSLFGKEIEVAISEEQSFILSIDEQDSFFDVLREIESFCEKDKKEISFKILPKEKEDNRYQIILTARKQGGYLGYPRDYNVPLTIQNVADIRYIVTFLANRSIVSIFNNQSSLEAAGDRIDGIHPLRFLLTVFLDDELKVGVINIRSKLLIWKDFIGGCKESLATEYSIGNITEYQIQDFSSQLEINPSIVQGFIQGKRWDDLVDFLMKLPRKGDHGRFDC